MSINFSNPTLQKVVAGDLSCINDIAVYAKLPRETRNGVEWEPLMVAIGKGYFHIVKKLLDFSLSEIKGKSARSGSLYVNTDARLCLAYDILRTVNNILSSYIDKDKKNLFLTVFNLVSPENEFMLNSEGLLMKAFKCKSEGIASSLLCKLSVKSLDSVNYSDLLNQSIENGWLRAVKMLLQFSQIKNSLSMDGTFYLFKASSIGNVDIVSDLLLCKEVLKSEKYLLNQSLVIASEKGFIDVVNTLLSVKRIADSANMLHNEPLRASVVNGHACVTERLLEIPNIRNEANELYVVRPGLSLQLKGKKVDRIPLLSIASERGDVRMLSTLLSLPDIQKSSGAYDNFALCIAATRGHIRAVRLLLTVQNIYESIASANNRALRLAARNRNYTIVYLLASIQWGDDYSLIPEDLRSYLPTIKEGERVAKEELAALDSDDKYDFQALMPLYESQFSKVMITACDERHYHNATISLSYSDSSYLSLKYGLYK